MTLASAGRTRRHNQLHVDGREVFSAIQKRTVATQRRTDWTQWHGDQDALTESCGAIGAGVRDPDGDRGNLSRSVTLNPQAAR